MITKEEVLKDIYKLSEEFDIRMFSNDDFVPVYLNFSKAEYLTYINLPINTTKN